MRLSFNKAQTLAQEILDAGEELEYSSTTLADGSTFVSYTFERDGESFEVIALNAPVVQVDEHYEWLYDIPEFGLQVRQADFADAKLTLALESDVEQAIVRGSLNSWSELVQVTRTMATFVDEELVTSVDFDDSYTFDDVPVIGGINESNVSTYQHVASLVLDLMPVFGTVKSVLELFSGKDLVTQEEIPLWLAAGGAVGSVVPGGKGVVKGAAKKIWTATKKKSAIQNAYEYYLKHGADFPEIKNAKEYVEKVRTLAKTKKDMLKRVRKNGDIALYNPEKNIILIKDPDGIPRTMFKPDPSKHGYKTNLEYFNAQ